MTDINEGEVLNGPNPFEIDQFGKYETLIKCSSPGLFVKNEIFLFVILISVTSKLLLFDGCINILLLTSTILFLSSSSKFS